MKDIERQLAKIADSAEFRRSPQLQRLLRYLVITVPAGTSANQYAIATAVLGRPASFTPEGDPIVRVEMRRLRKHLEHYYEQNPLDPVRIRIPVHRYEALVESASPPLPRVAVLPLHETPRTDALAHGVELADDIIHELGRCPDLAPLARTSVFALHARGATAEEITIQTGADWIVEGSLRRLEDQYEVRVSLLRCEGMAFAWHRDFTCSREGLPEIPRQVAAAIRRTVAPHAGVPAARRLPSAAAHILYLRGVARFNQMRTHSVSEAVDLFHQAILEDPQFIKPKTALIQALLLPFATGLEFAGAREQGLRLAADCHALDPESADSILAAGIVKLACDGNWAGSAADFRRVMDLEPHNSLPYLFYPPFLAICGQLEEARRLANYALSLDPLSAAVHFRLGLSELYAGHLPAAIASFEAGIQQHPQFPLNYFHQAAALAFVGERDAALRRADEADELAGSNPMVLASRGFVLAQCGLRDGAVAIVRQLEMLCTGRLVSPLLPAIVFSGLNDMDRAASMLRLALDRQSFFLLPYLSSPLLASLHRWDGLADVLKLVNCPVPLPPMPGGQIRSSAAQTGSGCP